MRAVLWFLAQNAKMIQQQLYSQRCVIQLHCERLFK